MLKDKSFMKPFLLGGLAALLLMLLTAAVDISPPSYGRYQISSWATTLGSKGSGFGAFVVDTATGETKLVYSRTFGSVGDGTVKKDQLKMPFGSIK